MKDWHSGMRGTYMRKKDNDNVAVGWFSSIKFKMIGSYVFMVACII